MDQISDGNRTTRSLKALVIAMIEKDRNCSKYLSLYRFRHHLEEIGWFRSSAIHMPVDAYGKSLPWYTYAAICFLENRLRQEMMVFEYGTGNSTLWWAERVASVITVEHDVTWYEYMKKLIPGNVEFKYCKLIDGEEYCHLVSKYDKQFSIVVIDGRDRVSCARNCLGALRDDGVIVWDNSDREEYSVGHQHLMDSGFRRLDFHGYGPINTHGWSTSIFYRKDNCLHI
jgi:hypothetical protein